MRICRPDRDGPGDAAGYGGAGARRQAGARRTPGRRARLRPGCDRLAGRAPAGPLARPTRTPAPSWSCRRAATLTSQSVVCASLLPAPVCCLRQPVACASLLPASILLGKQLGGSPYRHSSLPGHDDPGAGSIVADHLTAHAAGSHDPRHGIVAARLPHRNDGLDLVSIPLGDGSPDRHSLGAHGDSPDVAFEMDPTMDTARPRPDGTADHVPVRLVSCPYDLPRSRNQLMVMVGQHVDTVARVSSRQVGCSRRAGRGAYPSPCRPASPNQRACAPPRPHPA